MNRRSKRATAGIALMMLVSCYNQGNTPNHASQPGPVTAAATLSEAASKKDSSCQVAIKLLEVTPSKPPQKLYSVKLQLTNQHPESQWFVFRLNGSTPLPDSGRFVATPSSPRPFSSIGHTNKTKPDKGQAVVVDFMGEPGFTALLLPRHGRITFDTFVFYAFSDISDFEVWEVPSLLVNGKTPLETWLPYTVISDEDLHLQERPALTSLDWDTRINNYRQDYPNEKVDFIAAQAPKKCLFPLSP